MKTLSLFIVMAFLVPSAFAQINTPKPVTVTANMINISADKAINASVPKVMKFNFLNPFINTAPSARLTEHDTLLVREEMLFTQNMTVQYNNTFINLYVAPGDSLHLTINAALLEKENFEWLTITGDHADISTQLNKCHNYISKLPYKKYDLTLSVPNMLIAVKADYDRQVAALNSYATAQHIDPVIVEFMKRNIIYSISNWMNDYVQLGSPENSTKADRIEMFNDPFFETNDAGNFKSMMFPYHVSFYAKTKINQDSVMMAATKEQRWKDVVLRGATLISKDHKGISADYMLFSFISEITKKTPALLDELPGISNYFSDPLYYNYLKRTSTLANTVTFPLTPLAGVVHLQADGSKKVMPTGDLFTALAKKYPGKIIYIDVYATWCSPCLAEMKFAPALHSAFKDKGVVFVNLCLASDEAKWKALVKELPVKGENYFLDEDLTKLFMSTYRLSGYPSYLLVNKNGKLVNTQAPRPSDSETLNRVLNGLLMSK